MTEVAKGPSSLLEQKLLPYLSVLHHLIHRLGFALLDVILAKQDPKQPFTTPPNFNDPSSPPVESLPYGGMPLRKVITVFAHRVDSLGYTVQRIVVRQYDKDMKDAVKDGDEWKFSLSIVDHMEKLPTVQIEGEDEGPGTRADEEG